MELYSGRILAERYKLISEIGSGGFSVVWKARDLQQSNKLVAIKIILGSNNDDTIGQFINQDLKISRKVKHENILKYYGDFLLGEQPCMVTEYMAKGTLARKLEKEARLGEQEVAKLVLNIAKALNYIHFQSPPILHLDVKLENILVNINEEFILFDFGVSQELGEGGKSSQQLIAETPVYTTPERISQQNIGAPSDIFAFGVVLYECCTGFYPSGMPSLGQLVQGGLEKPSLDPQYSRRLQQLVHACLNLQPHSRPRADRLVEYAEHYLDHGYWPEIIEYINESRVTTIISNQAILNSSNPKSSSVDFSKAKPPIINPKRQNVSKKRFALPSLVGGLGILSILITGIYFLTRESKNQLLQKAEQLTQTAAWSEAFATYEEIMERDHSDPQVTEQLIVILDSIKANSRKNLKAADGYIHRKTYANAIDLLRETEKYSPALTYLPNDAESQALLRELYTKLTFITFDSKNYSETKKYYTKAIALDPNNKKLDQLRIMLTAKTSRNEAKIEQLADAIIQHDTEAAKRLLNNGAAPNACYQDNPLLLIAIQENQLEIINAMLSLGADPNNPLNYLKSKNDSHKYTNTPLLLAVEQNKQTLVQTLVEQGNANVDFLVSDPQSGEDKVWSPLRIAVIKGHTEIVAYLIKKNAKINEIYSKKKYTLLIDAARYNQTEALELLINANAKVNEVDENGMTALMWAADRDNIKAVRLLLSHKANKFIRSRDGFLAKEYTNKQAIKKILN